MTVCLLVAAICFGAAGKSTSSTVQGLLLNLAASAITIGATYSIVDYLLYRESSNNNKAGREMASVTADTLRLTIKTAVTNLFRQYDHVDDFDKHLETLNLGGGKLRIYRKDLAFFRKDVSGIIDRLEQINILYGYALKKGDRENMYAVYRWAMAIDGLLDTYKYAKLGCEKSGHKFSPALWKPMEILLTHTAADLYRSSTNLIIITK